jgi:hypothetical protein
MNKKERLEVELIIHCGYKYKKVECQWQFRNGWCYRFIHKKKWTAWQSIGSSYENALYMIWNDNTVLGEWAKNNE